MNTVANGTTVAVSRESSPPRWNHLRWRILDIIIGALFIYAGILKVRDPMSFAIDIDNYKTLPWFIGIRLAFYLPWLEILCGLALITRRLYLGALSILAVLTSIFIVASIVAKVRGLDISCGCFGHASKYLSFAGHLALDFAILGALLLLLFRQHHARALDDVIVNSGRQ